MCQAEPDSDSVTRARSLRAGPGPPSGPLGPGGSFAESTRLGPGIRAVGVILPSPAPVKVGAAGQTAAGQDQPGIRAAGQFRPSRARYGPPFRVTNQNTEKNDCRLEPRSGPWRQTCFRTG